MLQEAEISTLSEADCSKFGKKMKVRPEVEICGGRKIPKQFPKTFNQISDKEFRFSARTDIDYINENYKLGLKESEEYETLGGLIIHKLESIPEAGQEVKSDKLRFVIEEVSDRRIEVVRLFVDE